MPKNKKENNDNRRKKYNEPSFDFIRLIRFAFFMLVTLIIVYAYYLHTEGVLFQTISSLLMNITAPLFTFIKEYPVAALGGLLIFLLIFGTGYLFGAKKSSKRVTSRQTKTPRKTSRSNSH